MEEETATNPENVVETQNTTENTATEQQETKEEQPEEEQDTNAQDTKEQNEEDQELKEKQEKKREKKRKREVIENLAKSIFGGDSDEEEETEDSLKLDENLLSTNDLSVPDDVSSILGLKKKKKKKKDKGKERESKKKSKRALTEDSNAEEVDESQEYTGAEDAAPPPKEELSDFDAALNRLKKSRARRRKETDEDTTRMDEGVQALIAKMEEAAKNDIEDNMQKKPCLHKLKLLNEVAQQLRNKLFQRFFIENRGLKTLRKWLEPLPDHSLPNLKIRETILNILNEFPGKIETADLTDSGIGKVILFLWKHPLETTQNKRVAKALIDTWSRPVFQISEKYTELSALEESEHLRQKKELKLKQESSQTQIDLEAALDKKVRERETTKDSSTYHARIPAKVAFDFKIRPKSDTTNVKPASKSNPNIDKRLSALKAKSPRGGVKVVRAAPVSIEGRNLNY